MDTNPTTNATTNSSNTISSNVSITSGLDITYKAGQAVTLQPGFYVENGSTFLASIEDCQSASSKVAVEEEMATKQNDFEPIKSIKSTLKSYPNPVRQVLFIPYEYEGFSAEGRLLLFTSNGTILLNQKINLQTSTTIEVQLANYPDGMYFYQLISGQEEVSKGKFIKQE